MRFSHLPASAIGYTTPAVEVLVERGRLRLFAKAARLSDPSHTDEAAARAAGHPDLLVPPTYLFRLDMERADPFAWMAALGIRLADVLHGSQAFVYHRPAYAGEVLRSDTSVTDVYV